MQEEIKPGDQTSEHKMAKSAGLWAIVALILGFAVTVGSQVLEAAGTETKAGIWVGGIVAVAGVLLKMFASLGYIKSRTDVKVAAEAGQAVKAKAEADTLAARANTPTPPSGESFTGPVTAAEQ